MRRRIIALAVGLVIAAGTAVGVSAAQADPDTDRRGWSAVVRGPASSAAERSRPALVLRTRPIGEAGVDVGPEGDSAGDYFVFEERLKNARTGKWAGRDTVRCMLMIRSFFCDGVIRVDRGEISVHGAFMQRGDRFIAVVGGTDYYRNVTGTLEVRGTNGPGDRLLLYLNR